MRPGAGRVKWGPRNGSRTLIVSNIISIDLDREAI